jgi:hydrogenase-1 operon protein HyaF
MRGDAAKASQSHAFNRYCGVGGIPFQLSLNKDNVMRDFPIPVVAFGVGSQPEAEEVDYLPLPHEMATFSQPDFNLEADPEILQAACEVIENLRTAMQAGNNVSIELLGLSAKVVELINQSLGHGEVSVLVREPSNLHIQETVFAGVWRVQEISQQGMVLRDSLHACAIPPEVQQSALTGTVGDISAPLLRPGIMNAPAILNELLERSSKHQAGQAAHVINLSLLPMSPEDLEYLYEAFGTGTVSILSRGYGNCRITSTRLPNVWWVQYFNSMDQIILNTLEVVDVPEVALAADDDYQDSAERLGEWLAVMREQ